jgi:hypothetical protein
VPLLVTTRQRLPDAPGRAFATLKAAAFASSSLRATVPVAQLLVGLTVVAE